MRTFCVCLFHFCFRDDNMITRLGSNFVVDKSPDLKKSIWILIAFFPIECKFPILYNYFTWKKIVKAFPPFMSFMKIKGRDKQYSQLLLTELFHRFEFLNFKFLTFWRVDYRFRSFLIPISKVAWSQRLEIGGGVFKIEIQKRQTWIKFFSFSKLKNQVSK